MTTTQATALTKPMSCSTGESALRKVLLANSEFSIITGLAALVFGAPIADLFEVEQVWLIRMLGTGLLTFAAAVFFVSRSRRVTLDTWSAQISYADLGWVAGTIAVIVLGWLSTVGNIVMAVIAVVVFALGIGQLRARSAMRSTDG